MNDYRREDTSGDGTVDFFHWKYAIERIVGCLLMLLTLPLVLTLGALVKLTSRGPVFCRQTRIGLDGSVFEIMKFRTMRSNSEAGSKAIWSCKIDTRFTRVGRVLRKLHFDDLPQLWNVVLGEMSLVGPRPERPEICESLAEHIDGYHGRVTVKPGVTGLAQITLSRDESLEDVRRSQIFDLYYVNEADFWLELRILFVTAMRIIGIKSKTVLSLMHLSHRHILENLKGPTTQSSYAKIEISELEVDAHPNILQPPGQRVRAILSIIYSRKVFERVFAEAISDLQTEYIESLAAKNPWLERWIVIRGHLTIVKTIIEHSVSSTLGKIVRDMLT